MSTQSQPHEPKKSFLKTPFGVALLMTSVVAAALILFDHWPHVLSGDGLLIALLLFCVGSHWFMHGRHGHHGGRDRPDGK